MLSDRRLFDDIIHDWKLIPLVITKDDTIRERFLISLKLENLLVGSLKNSQYITKKQLKAGVRSYLVK